MDCPNVFTLTKKETLLVKKLLQSLGIWNSRITAYNPQGDPQPGRFNCTLLDMLGTFTAEKKQHWSKPISAVVHAYNSIAMPWGYSPYMLMFGREASLPVDLAFSTSLDQTSVTSHRGYVVRLRQNLKMAYKKAWASSNA